MRAVAFTGAGGNNVVEMVDRVEPIPGDDEVLIGVRYAGLNPADLQQRAGRYPPPPGTIADIPGLEVAGTVLSHGGSVLEWQVGDRVMGLIGGGGLADRVVAHRRHLVRVPESISEMSAAAIPEAFITAHDAIRTQARLAMGETLLVQGANGGVGSAAVQIGVAAGARVIGTSRSTAGREFVESLGGEAISPENCVAQVEQLTSSRGVDVILELVGAPNLPADVLALREKGRIVVIGIGGGTEAKLSLDALLAKRATVFGSGLRYRSLEEKALAVRNFEREVLRALSLGALVAPVDRAFPAAQARAAFDYLETASKLGKVLLQFD